jgi:hypothetical protein
MKSRLLNDLEGLEIFVLEISSERSRITFNHVRLERNGLLRHGASNLKRGGTQEKENRRGFNQSASATKLQFQKLQSVKIFELGSQSKMLLEAATLIEAQPID